MSLSRLFHIRTAPTESIIQLLEATTLGTNGAKYKHLDTRNRIYQADNPLFLSLERNEKAIGNITFCQRNADWYIRYFAFASMLQGGEAQKKEDKSKSFLKKELRHFFDDAFSTKGVQTMYAYIDPRNDRSKWMGTNFDFKKIGSLATQSFSRVAPRKSNRLEKVSISKELKNELNQRFTNERFYTDSHLNKDLYVLKIGDRIIAHAQVTLVSWEIVRLPGEYGHFMTKALPFVPILNQLIKPKKHQFLVPDYVWCENNDPVLIDELFNGILHAEKQKVIMWWVDANNPLYTRVKNTLSWGILNRIIGVPEVDVMCRTNGSIQIDEKQVQFVCAFDMV